MIPRWERRDTECLGWDGMEIRLLPSCLSPGEWKWTGECNHLPTVLNHKAHCLQLGPISVAGHHYVCLFPHTASKSLRVWGDSIWQSCYAKVTAFFPFAYLENPILHNYLVLLRKAAVEKMLVSLWDKRDKTCFSFPVPFVHARRLLAER